MLFFPFIAAVNLLPRQLVSVPNGNVSFLCASITEAITGIQWLLNNTLLEDFSSTDVRSVFRETQGTGKLFLSRVPLKCNLTSITCRAELPSGQVEVWSLLLVQGSKYLTLVHDCYNIIIVAIAIIITKPRTEYSTLLYWACLCMLNQ